MYISHRRHYHHIYEYERSDYTRNNSIHSNELHRREEWNHGKPEHNHREQEHVHEIQGSVQIAEPQEEPHNHRFATVSGEAIGEGINHFHEVKFRTDSYENHFHEYCGRTTCAIIVGDRHVHFLESVTSENDGHRHEFRVATLINDPIGEDCYYPSLFSSNYFNT